MADDISRRSNTVPVGQREAASEKKHEYTGEIKRANEDGSEIRGFLVDTFGYRITLRGTKDPRAGHGYLLYGELTHIPKAYRQEAIDSDA